MVVRVRRGHGAMWHRSGVMIRRCARCESLGCVGALANLALVAFVLGACAEPVPVEPDAFVAPPSLSRLSAQCLFDVPAAGELGGYWIAGNNAFLISEAFVSIDRNTNQTLLTRGCYHSDIGRIHSIVALKWRVTGSTLELFDGCTGWFAIGTFNESDHTLTILPASVWEQRDALVFRRVETGEIPEEARKVFEFCLRPEFY